MLRLLALSQCLECVTGAASSCRAAARARRPDVKGSKVMVGNNVGSVFGPATDNVYKQVKYIQKAGPQRHTHDRENTGREGKPPECHPEEATRLANVIRSKDPII